MHDTALKALCAICKFENAKNSIGFTLISRCRLIPVVHHLLLTRCFLADLLYQKYVGILANEPCTCGETGPLQIQYPITILLQLVWRSVEMHHLRDAEKCVAASLQSVSQLSQQFLDPDCPEHLQDWLLDHVVSCSRFSPAYQVIGLL